MLRYAIKKLTVTNSSNNDNVSELPLTLLKFRICLNRHKCRNRAKI